MDLEAIRKDGNTVLLSFSCGKDSLAAWVVLREAGFTVVPFYMQLVPGLGFVERSLAYYERFFGTHVLRVLHPTLYRHLKEYVSQPPTRQAAIDFLRLPSFTYEQVEKGVRRTAGVPAAWCAVGTRYADSPLRRLRMPADGISVKQHKFFPVCDMNKDAVIALLKGAGVLLPVDYELFGRSFDGIYYRYLVAIKERFPADYQRILEWFPEQGMELFRAELWSKYYGQAGRTRRTRRGSQAAGTNTGAAGRGSAAGEEPA